MNRSDGSTGLPLFMSAAHVQAMNERLAAAPEVRAACAALGKPELLAYRLRNEDGGPDVWWQMHFAPDAGARFALGPPDGVADLTLECGYWAMLQQVTAQRDPSAGPAPALAITTVGDTALLQRIAQPFAQAQQVALVPVRFPQRQGVPIEPRGIDPAP